MAHLIHRCPPKGVRGGLRRPEGVGEEIRTFPDFFPTRGGHGVDGVRGGWYINQGAQSLKIQAENGPPHPKIEKNKCVLK